MCEPQTDRLIGCGVAGVVGQYGRKGTLSLSLIDYKVNPQITLAFTHATNSSSTPTILPLVTRHAQSIHKLN